MSLSRRSLLSTAAGALAAPAILRPGRARAAEVSLKLHHFLPPVSNAHKHLLAPWAEKVEAASDGRIAIRIFPSMQLGGTPPQLYDQARDGVVDIVWTLPGYTPGRFPQDRGVRAAVRGRRGRPCPTRRPCRSSPTRKGPRRSRRGPPDLRLGARSRA